MNNGQRSVGKMMPHDDFGTVLRPDQAALIFDTEDGLQVTLPKYHHDEMVPDLVALLVAVMVKSGDAEWVATMLDEIDVADA